MPAVKPLTDLEHLRIMSIESRAFCHAERRIVLPFDDIHSYHPLKANGFIKGFHMIKKIAAVMALAAIANVASARETCEIKKLFGIIPIEVCSVGGGSGGGAPAVAPEIDAASAVAGLTLALGGLAVLRGRRSKGTLA